MANYTPLLANEDPKKQKKIINAWAFYDWANSAYPLVVSTAIFPIFYNAVTDPFVSFLGFKLSNSQVYTLVVAFSFLLVSIISPILSGIADYTGDKKRFLRFFCYLGSIACASLYFFDADHLELSMLSILIASTGFWSSLVFYNAYLPEIVAPQEQDRVSAKGFSMGYLGSSILLIICLLLIEVESIGMPAQYAFIMVGVWWIGFSHYTYAYLPKLKPKETSTGSRLTKGFRELRGVWNEIKIDKRLKRYLFAFFIFSMGVQTIMLVAVLFATKEIEMTTGELITSVLLIQFIAIPGSYLFSYSSRKIGNINTLIIAVIIWALCCVAAFYTYYAMQFYFLAAAVGLIMGGTQSLSRSTYSKMLPKTRDHASYFSFYDVSEKIAIVFGMVIFALLEDEGSMRQPTLGLATIFIASLIALFLVPKMKTISGNEIST